MLKTLARKHRSTVSKMAARHKAKIATPHGPRTCFEASVDARGQETTGRTVRRDPAETAEDGGPHRPPATTGPLYPHKELITRLLAGRCELCQATGNITVHHVRSLADLSTPGQPQPEWATAHGHTPPQDPRGLRRLPRAGSTRHPAPPLTQ